jgi:Zn-dependent M28 family amino/carboxypeptidase
MRALLQTGAALVLALGLASHAVADTADALREQALASSEAYAILESLTTEIGARPAGSEADARAVAWAVAKFKSLGYDKVTMEPMRFTAWRRGAESAEVTGPSPQRLAVTALGGSVGTNGDLHADVVAFPSLPALQAASPEQVRGKIVFLSQHMERRRDGGGYADVLPMRSNGASIVARKGASALLIRSLATTDDRLPHTGSVIYDGGATIPAAAISGPDADLLERLLLRGQPVQLRLNLQSTTLTDQLSYNVIGDITGRELPQEVVMLSAHLDSWDLGTGAVDDGFGVALTMAAGALIKRQPQAPHRTVRVVLFANEENGFDGARTYAARPPSELACHRLMLESDWGAGRIYALRHPPADATLTAQMAQALAPLGITLDGQAGTPGPDARFLAERKVPWLQLAQDASALFDHHHSANDTLDKVDPAALAQNTAAYAVVAGLAANAPATPCQP